MGQIFLALAVHLLGCGLISRRRSPLARAGVPRSPPAGSSPLLMGTVRGVGVSVEIAVSKPDSFSGVFSLVW